MLLMSYAGLGLHTRAAQQVAKIGRVDLERESERTLQELKAHGLVDRDDISNGNLTWNRELQLVMKIDFDHASVNGSKALSPAASKRDGEHGTTASVLKAPPDCYKTHDDQTLSSPAF
ncbi:hypothetical protein GMORB2_5182 [Geosmithia morbida]|uniref:Uncharacterized protein n=1 Tax=Geosmithia morbida TaxID=1094350 RepID=A0A9P5D5G0_9HYPO|nr:uncharacterized protein GMORB2_5182 [Geosmithia morbida]KAF4124516.1 hypothetical protein GMORB2_5182 [Geosmithia morbida]